MKPELLLLDFNHRTITKHIGKKQMGMTAYMKDYPDLTPVGVEDMRTISFLDHRSPFRPKTDGTFA